MKLTPALKQPSKYNILHVTSIITWYCYVQADLLCSIYPTSGLLAHFQKTLKIFIFLKRHSVNKDDLCLPTDKIRHC